MTVCLLYREGRGQGPAFYRVEIAMNLFQQVSVLRNWGVAGRRGREKIDLFDNLRDASVAADRLRLKALRRGYCRA